jgi:FAD/FMN-containing dehydrogenase
MTEVDGVVPEFAQTAARVGGAPMEAGPARQRPARPAAASFAAAGRGVAVKSEGWASTPPTSWCPSNAASRTTAPCASAPNGSRAATDRPPRRGQLQFACHGARRVAKEWGTDERQTGIPDGRDVARLRGALEGRVLLPGEDTYDQARQVWNAMVDRRPAVIARCASPADVAAAVRFGREHDLELGVRCGGHSVLGISVPAGGLMVDLTPMQAVRVDPERRRAWVQGGSRLRNLDRATQPFGLATTAGNVSHTGVGGLTLGGGMGWLARWLGLACDNVARFELVTAGGEVVFASETENPDLYWGLRGGGGNFGVVTEFEFCLHPVGTAALLVELYHAPDHAPAALRRWRDLLPDAPRQATLTAWAGTSGEAPFLPPELHGRPLINVGYVWVGDPEEGRALLPALRDGAVPLAERVEEMTYLEVQTMDDHKHEHGWRRYWKGHYLREFGDGAIDAFVSRGVGRGDGDPDPASLPSATLQAYGGAIGAIGDDDTAFAQRGTLVEFVADAVWTDPAIDESRIAAARRYGAAIEPFASGVYVNSLADEGEAGTRRAYGSDQLARLAAVKERYDPDNIFHLNHNIRPRRPGA